MAFSMKNKRLLIAFFLVGCTDTEVNRVQDLSISPEHNKPISKVLDDRSICSSSGWTSYEQDEENSIVEYRCELSGAREYYKSVFLNEQEKYDHQKDQTLKSYQSKLKEQEDKLKSLNQEEQRISKHLDLNKARMLELEKSKTDFIRAQRDKLFEIENQISNMMNEASLISDEIQLINYSSSSKDRSHSRLDGLILEYKTLTEKISKLKKSRYSLPKFEAIPEGIELINFQLARKEISDIKKSVSVHQAKINEFKRKIQFTQERQFTPPLVPKQTFEVWKWQVPKKDGQPQVIYSALEQISDEPDVRNSAIMFDSKLMINELHHNKEIANYRDYYDLIQKVKNNG